MTAKVYQIFPTTNDWYQCPICGGEEFKIVPKHKIVCADSECRNIVVMFEDSPPLTRNYTTGGQDEKED